MKNKKGFTLVELLAVIVVIAIVSSIATVGVIAVRNAINESLLSSKIEILESSAVYWGQDNMILLVKDNMIDDENYIEYSDSSYGYAAVKTVDSLADYISEGDTCIGSDDVEYTCVANDVTGEDMGSDIIYIYVANNRVYAKYADALS